MKVKGVRNSKKNLVLNLVGVIFFLDRKKKKKKKG